MLPTCRVDGCEQPVKRVRSGYCYGHYMKNWRYGTPTPVFEPTYTDVSGQRFGTLVATSRQGRFWVCDCDCGATRLATTNALRQFGDSNTCGTPGRHLADTCGYSAAHNRVRRLRGAASNRQCVDCGVGAFHWSYDHSDPDELMAHGRSGRPMAYSAKIEHYVPRCVSCHKRHDLAIIHATYSEA